MNLRLGRLYKVLFLLLLFLVGVVSGYIYFKNVLSKNIPPEPKSVSSVKEGGFLSLKIYYPVSSNLWIEERKIPKKIEPLEIAKGIVEEFIKIPVGGVMSDVPRDVKLIGIYKGVDQIVYIDFSDEFRRNFQGDALTEFYLLKGLYKSIISNVPEIKDVKILIEGKEIETLGGHLYLLYPLRYIFASESESEVSIEK